ncbi:GTP-binding protein 2 [Termitomyces sp. J132]|nr:hypothetical protein H2248_003381 [Termitomyces sp. 'cryptogamus']KNZ75993.1 GTP-binding protein 2 [Termitomyces sp. J132]
MFGESESESPRVPSPWDSLQFSPSPSVPRLVPENDDGNVEYKLQLLEPSPARFARLVTQLKWRLLEGGGQAYYELGVADSGALVGLPRVELEQSLETLEMMAGEIGASVIVVKEIEVPAAMAGLAAAQTSRWNGERKRRLPRPCSETGSTTETESTLTTDFDDEDYDAMASTVVLDDDSAPLFAMDPEPDVYEQSSVSIDLEIASVFKPRPMRARMQMHTSAHYVGPTKTKRLKKIKHITNPDGVSTTRALTRRQVRDRKREEKRRALIAHATSGTISISTHTPPSLSPSPSPSPGPVPFNVNEHTHDPTPAETSALVSGLAALHVSLDDSSNDKLSIKSDDDFLSGLVEDDDVFVPLPATAGVPTTKDTEAHGSRLIVEALVVRKMSLDEAFLDFGGFMLT